MKISKSKLVTTVILLTTLLAAFSIQSILATNYTNVNSYCWVEGVFDTDSYSLYPYANQSLDVGFSKYGEMIGYNEATGIGLGLQYPGYAGAGNTYDQDQLVETSVDPFANEQIDVDVWMNGWFIDIWYRKATGDWREIWAFAMFSDGALHGGNWIKMPAVDEYASNRPLWQRYAPFANPDSDTYPSPKPAYGGRKSNGDCVTDPITIVYNGPRKYVAVMKTRISDGATGLVDLYFTLIFNKADKNVILLKDVKRLYDKGPLNVQFGNRGEWDLSPPSYVHFYTDEPVSSWDVNDNGYILNASSTNPTDEGHDFLFEYMSANKHPKKWWDEVPESEYPQYVGSEVFNPDIYPFNEWFETQYTSYTSEWHTDQPSGSIPGIKEHSYAVAQVIDADAQYVGALAVWPHPEFWSVSNSYVNPYAPPTTIALMLVPISRLLNWHQWTVTEDPTSTEYPHGRLADRQNVWIKQDDMSFEPDIPFIIYEHDFKLQLGVMDIYRIASVYVLTDWHDADDYNANDLNGDAVRENKIDREVQYQLDEIFNSWDIYDAMHKNTKRWVQFFDRDIGDHAWDGLHYYQVKLDSYRTIETGDKIPSLPVYRGGAWDAYNTVSEKVLVNTGTGYELIWPHDTCLTHDPPPRSSVYDDYHMLDPIPYENTGVNTPYYIINPENGTISFWKWDDNAEDYLRWYLPTGSIVKVEWSSEHEATTAGQWDEETLLIDERIDGVNYQFPLHHDIIADYRSSTEVFIVEQSPERIYRVNKTDGTPWYYWWTRYPTYLYVYNVSKYKEINIKYNTTALQGSWYEEKFISNGSRRQRFTLQYNVGYIEKVWIDSEKAITDGDYVYSEADGIIYMEEPLAAGEWLFVNYTHLGAHYEDWFYGSGYDAWDRNVFGPLSAEPDVGTLQVWDTEIIEEIINETCYGAWPYGTMTNVAISPIWTPNPSQYTYRPGQVKGPPSGVKCPVPNEAYAGLPDYSTKIWVKYGHYTLTQQYEECEWIKLTDQKLRGNYIIRETSTCDELVLDQPPLNSTQVRELGGNWTTWSGQELKIVYKVPSGRWEWGAVGKTAASVDSLGAEMVTAAFKNKLIEFGIGGLDIQDTAQGPRVPSLVVPTADSLGRYSLYNDWCYSRTADANAKATSWPITSSNIITVGGGAVNKLALYSNDWTQAIVTSTPLLYSVTCWDRDTYTGGDVNARYGYAIISTYEDKNATAILLIQGWTGQDTYYACKWFDVNKYWLQHINTHVTDLVLKIEYKYSTGAVRCVPVVTIVEMLGTLSEKPQHDP